MAAAEVVISGLLYVGKSGQGQPVTLVGIAGLSGLEVGGGPIIGQPPVGGPPGSPTFPIWGPPGIDLPDKPGYPPSVGGGPIIPVPPDSPNVPPPGSPPQIVGGTQPVNPITPPPAV